MSRSLLCTLICWSLLPTALAAQLVPELAGARAAATGMASVTVGDVWAIQNNIGALATLEKPTVAFSFNTRLRLQELTTFGALAGIPLKSGVASASFTRFGTGAYHVQTASIGYSHKISYVSVGVKVGYLQQSVETYGSHRTLVLEAGGKAELFPKLHFAAHAYNLTQSSFKTNPEELLPVLLKAGLAYLASDHIQLYIQTSKHLDYAARFSGGLEYQITPSLSLRTGILTAPVVASFGLGFCPGSFRFDYAFRHHVTIGAAHHLSISYSFHQYNSP